MPNYQLGKIYQIIDNTNSKIYIGSSCEPILARRLAGHKVMYDRYVKGKGQYVSSFEVLKNENYSIILIESYPCNSKDELTSRERYYIELNECVNKSIPGRTIKEYYIDNKEQKIKHQKEYNNNNKEQIAEKQLKKYDCECGGKYCHIHKSKHIKTNKHQNYIKSLYNDI